MSTYLRWTIIIVSVVTITIISAQPLVLIIVALSGVLGRSHESGTLSPSPSTSAPPLRCLQQCSNTVSRSLTQTPQANIQLCIVSTMPLSPTATLTSASPGISIVSPVRVAFNRKCFGVLRHRGTRCVANVTSSSVEDLRCLENMVFRPPGQ